MGLQPAVRRCHGQGRVVPEPDIQPDQEEYALR
jgi:hypothetical protein